MVSLVFFYKSPFIWGFLFIFAINLNSIKMKKIILISTILLVSNVFAQENFAGYNASNRIGIVQSSYHPSLLSFQTHDFDLQLGGLNAGVSNNKLNMNDFFGDDFEAKLWSEGSNISFRIDAEIIGLGAGFTYKDWGFGLLSKSNIKMNVTDINSKLGNAIINGSDDLTIVNSLINVKENQRINATAWSEIGASVSKIVFGKEKHQLSIGATFKLLMPASYANFGLSNLNANLSSSVSNDVLLNASGNLNIAYSGNLANDFTDSNSYTKSIFGKPNGFGLDFGTTYQWKNSKGETALLASASVRNIGSMTFKGNDNENSNYTLGGNIDLINYNDLNSIEDIKNQLIKDGHLTLVNGSKDIKVNLPTTLNLMASAKIISKFHASINLQQSLNDKNSNDQITSNNFFTVTPKLVFKNFELYAPLSNSDLTGFSSGFGLRAGGFYIGSGSVISATLAETKLIDFYMGFSVGL
jgi:Family of unknown function (DUF5723)